jgi:ribulose-5-phosphate 4-epimerase/fuculose-1-phosphate aldolase
LPTKDAAIDELIAANKILGYLNVLDAYGHVSMRHPDDPKRFLLSRSRSPELVDRDDIMEFGLDGEPIDARGRPPYLERYIHGGIYEARPDVNGVVHSHAAEVVAFGISKQPLIPVWHAASDMGAHVPVWDIREHFGDATNLLVSNREQGLDLARRLGSNNVVLMRGHGFSAAGSSLFVATRIAAYLPRNAQILTTALQFGQDVVALSEGEVKAMSSMDPNAPAARRGWEYWCVKAGIPIDRL